MANITPEPGQYANLLIPYKGYRRIELIEQIEHKWLVRVCGSGLELEYYEDEFEVED
ncbi:hypothetical protein [Bacteroides fragilis]|uniref:hypothetical protein n=1 Tax=Bacteroides fragilis TaxID=817 RepID=UPI0015F8D0A7|nr:hypothetical protein [Bacteroides fragilis]